MSESNILEKPSDFNPTAAVELDFGGFLGHRRKELDARSAAPDVADYAFGMDRTLRQKLARIALARKLARLLVSHITPIQRQLHLMGGVAVGPRQFSHIHDIGHRCAERLGIGVPQTFIVPSPHLNAYTFATDDAAPMVVLSSSIVEASSPEELTFVVGHECGHVANLHGVYNSVVQTLVNPLAKTVLKTLAGVGMGLKWITSVGQLKLLSLLVTAGLQTFFLRWSRCAEVTCDRAGLICCGDLKTSQLALARLGTGGVSSLEGIDIEEYIRQIEPVRSSIVRLTELFDSHPVIPKRLHALALFGHCEVLYRWRPELSAPDSPRSLEAVDEACEGIVGVVRSSTDAAQAITTEDRRT